MLEWITESAQQAQTFSRWIRDQELYWLDRMLIDLLVLIPQSSNSKSNSKNTLYTIYGVTWSPEILIIDATVLSFIAIKLELLWFSIEIFRLDIG